MDDTIMALAKANKLERVSTYRQLQGISHQLYQLSGRTIDEFDVPPSACIRATMENESRVTVDDGGNGEQSIAYVFNRVSRERTQVLPDGYDKALLLTLMLDQGSIGTAGCAFAM